MRSFILGMLFVVVCTSTAVSEELLWFPFDHSETPNCGYHGKYQCPEYPTHTGMDYPCDDGTSLYSPISGTVVYLRNNVDGQDCGAGYGNHIIIQTDDNQYQVLLGHMLKNSFAVEQWDHVSAGEYVGKSSNSGLTKKLVGEQYLCGYGGGWHLHLEVRHWENDDFVDKDPDNYWTSPLQYGSPAPTFIATQYGNATIAEPGPYYPGEIVTCTIRFRNDGTATWHNTTGADKSYIELVSCNSSGQPPWVTSYFYDAGMGWLHDKVPCTMQESLREPGQVATFSFQGKIPLNTQLGQRSIYFGPVFNSHIMQGWNGNGFTITVVEPTPPPATGFTELVGKFTNDGYSEVCVYEPGNGKWWVAANTAANNCFDRQSSTPWIDAFSTGSSYVALSGDIGGSDLDDICTLDTVLGRWKVAYSTGSAFSYQPGPNQSAYWLDDWGKASVDKRYTPLLGDFNNDGFKEPLLYEAISGNWYVSLRDASLNRFNTTGVAWITGFGDGVGQYIPLTGNFVGDGKYDIALYHKSSGNWYVAENTGSAFVRCSPSLWITGFGDNGTYIPFAGQIRGDVYTDIGLFEPSTGNWFVAQSTGSAFTKLNGPEEYGAWITDYGNPSGYRPLFGYFSWDSYMDVGLYQPGTGSWFVAINDGNPDRFTRSDGVGDFDSWLSGWAKIQGSPKIVSDQTEALPQSYALAQNYPNPFNPVTRISFTLPQPSMTTLEVFNILGQKVTTLVHAKLPAGAHVYTWDAHQQASGIYLYRLQTEDAVETKKMLFLK